MKKKYSLNKEIEEIKKNKDLRCLVDRRVEMENGIEGSVVVKVSMWLSLPRIPSSSSSSISYSPFMFIQMHLSGS